MGAALQVAPEAAAVVRRVAVTCGGGDGGDKGLGGEGAARSRAELVGGEDLDVPPVASTGVFGEALRDRK